MTPAPVSPPMPRCGCTHPYHQHAAVCGVPSCRCNGYRPAPEAPDGRAG